MHTARYTSALEVRAVEVRAVEVQSSESCGGANYQKTWVTIESVVVCFGANTFHWLNVLQCAYSRVFGPKQPTKDSVVAWYSG